MAIKLRTQRPDKLLKKIVSALREYESLHPSATIDVYRQNSLSVRIRVIDPQFRGQSRVEREEDIWQALYQLPEETMAEVSFLLLLTPHETKDSVANAEFENPRRSRL
ncbi:MAG TPA: hypothetical protein VIK18_09700 [Pirellulales bacterium]